MTDLDRRRRGLETFVDRLFDRDGRSIAAVADDGWSESMVEAGLRRHRQTWEVGGIVEAVESELASLGGLDALDGETSLHARPPRGAAHVWPRLPGAGLTPVLFGALLGLEQWVRPSSRAGGFALRTREVWERVDELPPLKLVEELPVRSAETGEATGSAGSEAGPFDVVVASGSDEALASIRDDLEAREGMRATNFIGYGHRTSFAVVDDAEGRLDLAMAADDCAAETVLWHQSGCFSPRGVLFAGSSDRLEAFAAELGGAIARWERKLDAEIDDVGLLADRRQARDVAAVEHAVYGEGFGWAEIRGTRYRGELGNPHTLPCHRISGPDDLAEIVVPGAHELQGAGLVVGGDDPVRRREWIDALVDLGVTRVTSVDRLQTPPADWWHDGRPNILGWLNVCRVEVPRDGRFPV